MKCYLILVIEIGKVYLLRIKLSSSILTRRHYFYSTFIPEDNSPHKMFMISESSSNLREFTLFFLFKKINSI